MKATQIISLNPSLNYAVLGAVPVSTTAEVHAKVAQARAAQPAWAALTIAERVTHLSRFYQQLQARQTDLQQLLADEIGMPVKFSAELDLTPALQYFQGYLHHAERWLAPEVVYASATTQQQLHWLPKGVVAASVPWNYPVTLLIWAVVPNLLAGNTIVVKQSEECVLIGQLLAELVASAQLPGDICQFVTGDSSVGESLMQSDIDHIWFTGSTAVGRHLYQVAASKFVSATLELGGSAPGVVLADADLTLALPSIYANRFLNSGQTCDGLKRLIVHESLLGPVVDGLMQLLATKRVGPATAPTTDIGPLVAERQLLALERQVADAVTQGARIVTGGQRPAHLAGAYYLPTLLTNVTRQMLVWQEEVFGPVLPIVTFKTDAEAVTLANDTSYGLGGHVYTADPARGQQIARQIKTGNISINQASAGGVTAPFGGLKASGFGREHGQLGLRELCNVQLIAGRPAAT